MIYLDTSVALAHLLGETRYPPASFWSETLFASRLLQYELFVRIHAKGLAKTHREAAEALVARLALLELSPPVLSRALEPFPVEVRTLDALHLASADFLRSQGVSVALASYGERMLAAARAIGIPLVSLD
jgi:predicted nucleic acid-binding protein